jgi:hypothetical protein
MRKAECSGAAPCSPFRGGGRQALDVREALCIEKPSCSVRGHHTPTPEEEREHDHQASIENACHLVSRTRAVGDGDRPDAAGGASRYRSRQLTIETLEGGEVLGWSWLFPPYRWRFSARVVEPVRVIVMDGVYLRDQAEEDHNFGYELEKRMAQVVVQRLQAARLRLLDVYGAYGPHKREAP